MSTHSRSPTAGYGVEDLRKKEAEREGPIRGAGVQLAHCWYCFVILTGVEQSSLSYSLTRMHVELPLSLPPDDTAGDWSVVNE